MQTNGICFNLNHVKDLLAGTHGIINTVPVRVCYNYIILQRHKIVYGYFLFFFGNFR